MGYYVNNEYADEELREEPPATVRLDRVVRNILAEKPRVAASRASLKKPSPSATADAMDDEEGIENQVPGTGMMGDGCVPGEAGTMAAGAHAGFGYAGVPAGQGLAEMRSHRPKWREENRRATRKQTAPRQRGRLESLRRVERSKRRRRDDATAPSQRVMESTCTNRIVSSFRARLVASDFPAGGGRASDRAEPRRL